MSPTGRGRLLAADALVPSEEGVYRVWTGKPDGLPAEATGVGRLVAALVARERVDVHLFPSSVPGAAWAGRPHPCPGPPPDGPRLSVYRSGSTGPARPTVTPAPGTEAWARPQATKPFRWLLSYQPSRRAGVAVLAHVVMTKDELVVPRSLASDDLLGAAADLGVTAVSWTPTLFRRLLLLGGRPALSSLSFEQVTFGGEAASQDVLDAARRLWPTARVTHTLASAEWGDICATSDGLAGYPAEKLATGRAVVAASGELLVDGVPTGDVWRREGDRYHFVGRTGDIVTVASEQVSLHEVAAAAKRVSGVVEAVADVISNPVAGSLVVLDYEGAVEPSVVRSALRTLPRAAWPASIRQVEHLHPTEAGKAPSSATTKGQAEI